MISYKASVFRKETCNATHRLNNHALSPEENRKLSGNCNNPNYRGHNYTLIIKTTGLIDSVTGCAMGLKYLSDLAKNEIPDQFDHNNLHLDTSEFKEINPTAENIAERIFVTLRHGLDEKFDLKINLYEIENNSVKYPA